MGNTQQNQNQQQTYEDFSSKFREDVKDITFIGKTKEEAINMLEELGYTKYKVVEGTLYVTKVLRKEIILYVDKNEVIIKEPQCY